MFLRFIGLELNSSHNLQFYNSNFAVQGSIFFSKLEVERSWLLLAMPANLAYTIVLYFNGLPSRCHFASHFSSTPISPFFEYFSLSPTLAISTLCPYGNRVFLAMSFGLFCSPFCLY